MAFHSMKAAALLLFLGVSVCSAVPLIRSAADATADLEVKDMVALIQKYAEETAEGELTLPDQPLPLSWPLCVGQAGLTGNQLKSLEALKGLLLLQSVCICT